MTNIVVIGGTGLIGSRVVATLQALGHHGVPASPKTGVDTLTGAGLADVLTGASVVLDVCNSPSFDDASVLAFFTTSTTNLLAAEKDAGVKHHVTLSVVGAPKLGGSGYMRANAAQEALVTDSGLPYTIVQATQFFEFVEGIAASATVGDTVRLPPALIQPMAADDVAEALIQAALRDPVNGTTEVAGPQRFGLDQFVRTALAYRRDPRHVLTDPAAPYYGAVVPHPHTLIPGDAAQVFSTRFTDWLHTH